MQRVGNCLLVLWDFKAITHPYSIAAPAIPPPHCAAMYRAARRKEIRRHKAKDSETAGFTWPPARQTFYYEFYYKFSIYFFIQGKRNLYFICSIYIKTEIIQNNISISKLLIIKIYIRLKLKSKRILGRDTNMFYLDDKTDNNQKRLQKNSKM